MERIVAPNSNMQHRVGMLGVAVLALSCACLAGETKRVNSGGLMRSVGEADVGTQIDKPVALDSSGSSLEVGTFFNGRRWRLSPECRLEGGVLTVNVPKSDAVGVHCAMTTVDLAPYETEGFCATIRVRGEDVSVPPEPYNGVKFMFHYRDKSSGKEQWPGAKILTGTFGWRDVSVQDSRFRGAKGGMVELVLGLQNSSGTVSFDLSTLEIANPRERWPVTNLDHVAVYTPEVSAMSRKRGVMSPERPMNEDDFRTLGEWGATLLRYQMVRGWSKANGNQDLAEYDHWLDGKLDHFDKFILPMAIRHGMKVVLDLHVPPGGRDSSSDMNMLYDTKYADHFVKTWRRIARRFKGRKGIYGYDLINEPVQSGLSARDCDYWSIQRRAAEAVRKEDPLTPIVIESNVWDGPSTFSYLSPLTLTNVIYQVHMYAPLEFTHQRVGRHFPQEITSWPDEARGWNRDFVRRKLQPVRDFQLKHGARIYVGEFSAIAWAQGADNYLRDCMAIFEEYGWDWTYHAFREWSGWSVEHEGPDASHMKPSLDNPRRRVLLEGFNSQLQACQGKDK